MLLRLLMQVMAGCLLAVECLPQSQPDPSALLREADHLSDLFNWADAGPLYAQAEKLFAASGGERNALYAKFGAIRGSMETANLPDTSDYLSGQLQTALVQKDLRLRLMCLIVKGDIDGEIDSAPARADWEEAVAIATRLGDKKWQSRASAELGFEQFLAGDVGTARKAVASALITAHATGDIGAEIRYLAAIGTVLALNRLDDQAISYLDRAIDLARKYPDSGYPFFPVAGKIQALINKKDYERASALIDESEREATRKHKDIKLAQVLLLRADIALEKQHKAEAVAVLNDTAQLTRHSHSRLFADSEIQLADAYREEHDFEKAEGAAETAVAATGQSRDMYLAPARLRTLAEIEVALGRTKQASQLYQRATDIIEGMVANAPDSGARAALLAEMSPIFVDHFSLAAQEKNTRQAFHIIEQVRGRIVAERLLQPALDKPIDTQTEDRIRRLKVQLVRTQRVRQRRTLIDQLFFAEQARWTEISGANLRAIDPSIEITLVGVQRQLRQNEVILEYVLGETESFCLRISRSAVAISKLASRKNIEAQTRVYLAQLRSKKNPSSESRALFASLIQPMHLPPGLNSLVIVPDGVLHLVPFSALEENSGEFLGSDHRIWYLPSAGMLTFLRGNRHSEARRMFLGVGGVEYGSTVQPTMLAQAKSELTRGDYYDVDLTRLPDLPGTEEEIRAAADILGADDATLLVGRNGTETEFKSEPLSQFRILHLAIHGRANTKNPDRAALIFRPDPPAEDGLLEPREILGLRLNADLVVLSACDTAVGHLQGEEGIANLARAFLSAGFASVVSTLWPIDDTYSLFLMKRFYTHLHGGVTEAEALRLSQEDLLHKFGEDTPASDWAAFTLLGDGDRVIFPKKRFEVSSR